MFWMWIAVAMAEDVAEEVLVWARPYARFDDTRWLVRSEVITPSVVQLGTASRRIRVNTWQLEAVIHCQLDGTKKRLREALCTIEDAALRAHLSKARPKDTEAVAAMARAMVGRRIQLQVNQRGRVPSLDLDGLTEDNYDQRQVAGGARTLVKQLAAAFHMEFPKQHRLGVQWISEREPLLGVAAPKDGISSVQVAHRIDRLDGHWVQQSVGRATSTTAARNISAGVPCFKGDANPRCPKTPTGEPVYREEPDFLDLESIYTTQLNAVSVLDLDRGYPVERMWSVMGKPSGGTTGTDYWSSGVLRELGKDETVTLGGSGMVGAPNATTSAPGLPVWVPVGG